MGSRISIDCPQCGKSFSAPTYDVERRNRRFCGVTCARASRRTPIPDPELLVSSYETGKSTNQLAIDFGVSKGTIWNWFKMFGIETRSISEGITVAQAVPRSPEQHAKATPPDKGAFRSWKGRSRAGRRATLGGLYVRSSWEHNYALILNYLQEAGAILRWEYEPDRFEFPVTRGNRSYTPDFKVFLLDGSFEYHEIKGYMDDASRVKLARMARHHGDVVLRLIDGPIYKQIAREYQPLLPDWES